MMCWLNDSAQLSPCPSQAALLAPGANDLKQPYGNHLEALKSDRKGQHSIRVNDQWRICFKWSDGDIYDVEIVDYH